MGRTVIAMLLGLLLTQGAIAKINLDVDLGWEGHARRGVWMPVFVQVSNEKPTSAVIELYTPHDSSTAMNIRMPIAIGPSAQTYVIYAPLISSWDNSIVLRIRDRTTRKLLAEQALLDPMSEDGIKADPNLFKNSDLFIAESGRRRVLAGLGAGNDGPQCGFLRQSRLPGVTKGFDGVSVLVLNQPDFLQLELVQQNTICDWVRAGGHLVLWLSEDPIPPGRPLVGLLPCEVGDPVAVSIAPTDLRRAGLSDRFAKLKGRALTPTEGASRIPLLNSSSASAITGSRGYGQVTVLSFDASDLLFDQPDHSKEFWGKALSLNLNPVVNTSSVNYGIVRQNNGAAGQIIDLLGNVPGVGSFGFGYVAVVLIGMMLLVGPVDWFVLKRMGRQHWTWVTTSGWIALITIVALFIGSLFRSGQLHFRTLAVVDQVDDAVIDRLDVAGIYSPKTEDYQLEPTSNSSWWEPMSIEQGYFRSGVMQTLDFRQDGRGNTPDAMLINVWNLRFLRGKGMESYPPVIRARLALQSTTSGNSTKRHIVGTIGNLSNVSLEHMWLRTREHTTELSTQPNFPAGGILPGQTLRVDMAVDLKPDTPDQWGPPVQADQLSQSLAPRDPFGVARAATELSEGRSKLIDERLAQYPNESIGVLYCESESPTPAAKLLTPNAIQKHWQVFRDVVSLENLPLRK
jgi:hypothetical protein